MAAGDGRGIGHVGVQETAEGFGVCLVEGSVDVECGGFHFMRPLESVSLEVREEEVASCYFRPVERVWVQQHEVVLSRQEKAKVVIDTFMKTKADCESVGGSEIHTRFSCRFSVVPKSISPLGHEFSLSCKSIFRPAPATATIPMREIVLGIPKQLGGQCKDVL